MTSPYNETLVDQKSHPIAGALVSVFDGTGATATLTTQAGAALDNPVITDAAGNFGFYADDGIYKVQYSYGGRVIRVDNFVQIGAAPPLPASILASLSTSGGAALVGSNDGAGGSLWTTIAGFINYLRSSVGSSLVGYLPSGTGAVATTAQSRLRRSVYVDDYGAIGDGGLHPLSDRFGSLGAAQAVYPFVTSLTQTIDWAAITAGMVYLNSVGGGELLFGRGKAYRVNTPVEWLRAVDLVGSGSDSSRIQAIDCHAVTINFTQGIGNSRCIDLAFLGNVGNAYHAIHQIQIEDSNELDGVELRNLQIRYFDTAISLNTCRNVLISNVTGLNINNGVRCVGKVLEIQLTNVRMIYGGGPGSGTSGTGLFFDHYVYTAIAEQYRVEGLKITSPFIYGFTTGIYFKDVLEVGISDIDVIATLEGIKWETVLGTLNIDRGRVELQGATASVGLWGIDLSASTQSKVNIRGVQVVNLDATAPSPIGLLLGTSVGAGNQNNVSVEDCLFEGMKAGDIVSYQSGGHRFVGNKCYSTAPTNSIALSNVPSGRICYVEQNECMKEIVGEAASVRSGDVQIGVNHKNGTTLIDGSKIVGTIVYDPPSLVDGAGDTSAAVTVTGAAFGDTVEVSAPYDLQGIVATAYISAANAAKIRLQNETGGTIDLASGTWRVTVRRSF